MDLQARCRRVAAALNQTEGWNLPPEALEDLSQEVLRFVSSPITEADLITVIRNYFYDGPRVAMMMQPGHLDGERCWQAVRDWFVKLAASYGVASLDIEDVAQEAWHKARQGLHLFSFRSRLHTWLGAIILHACQDWHRRQRKRVTPLSLDHSETRTLAETIADAQIETPEEVLLQEERAMLLDITLERLLSHREVLILRHSFLERYGIEQVGDTSQLFRWTDERIAQQVGLAPSSIPSTRKRILERLKSNPELVRLVEEIFGSDWLSRSREVSE